MRPFRFSLLPVVLLWLAAEAGAGEAGPVWKVEPGEPWTVSGQFMKGKDVSAAAQFKADRAVVGSDETRGVQAMELDVATRTIQVGPLIRLLPGEGTEIDIEGVAAAPALNAYFVTGSQAMSRQKGRLETERHWVFKLPVDADGRPRPAAVEKVDFHPVLRTDPVLAAFLDRPAADNGLDVEGLAERDGQLFFGLRAPSLEGMATVIEVKAAELFGGTAKPAMRIHRLALGAGRGIRELTALKSGGFLLLAGASGSGSEKEPAGAGVFEIWTWAGPGAAAGRLGVLEAVPGKAEGLLIYDETADAISGIVFHDGAKNGGPVGFRLVKSPSP